MVFMVRMGQLCKRQDGNMVRMDQSENNENSEKTGSK